MSMSAQRRRATEIEQIGKSRRLTLGEMAEYENLAHRSYMRAWRAQQAERFGADWNRCPE